MTREKGGADDHSQRREERNNGGTAGPPSATDIRDERKKTPRKGKKGRPMRASLGGNIRNREGEGATLEGPMIREKRKRPPRQGGGLAQTKDRATRKKKERGVPHI